MPDQAPSNELDPNKLPGILPILPLFDAVLFPKMVLPLVVMQAESIRLIDTAMTKDRIIGLMVSEKSDQKDRDPLAGLKSVGVSALILKMAKSEENKAQLLVQGLNRFRVKRYIETQPFIRAEVTQLQEPAEMDTQIEALMANLNAIFAKIVELSPGLPQEFANMAKSIKEGGILADMITSTVNSTVEEKQAVLEIVDVTKRLKKVTHLANHQLEILELGNKIQSQVKGDMDKRQREYYLRQQLKAIQEELGEADDAKVELEEYRAKIEELKLPEDARKEAERELGRLSRMHPSSAEYTVALTYLDWITSLPWHQGTEDAIDIKRAREVLDEDHYGLQKAKRRVLEYLAVRKLKPDSKGPILCFAGPPGTGKTSLGNSIAKALGRKFIRISLGGVRDEAEIRGHRRTYIGAMPGKIILSMQKAEVINPVFCLEQGVVEQGAARGGDAHVEGAHAAVVDGHAA